MKYYQLNTVFSFGKHQGKTLLEVLDINPGYIDWCAIHLDHFFLDEDVIEAMEAENPRFRLSTEAMETLEVKAEAGIEEQDYSLESQDDYEPEYDSGYYDEPMSAFENPYYNDALDLDQQSPEFWDAF